jgi:phage head maturation protease
MPMTTTEPDSAARAAGAVTNPRATERLHAYWVHGEGAAKIRWGQPGDFDRCTTELGKYIRDPEGYCNLAHHEATGMWPAEHAAMEKHAGRAAPMADSKPYGDVKYADPKNGKYPIDTADHARAAWSYINMPKNAGQYPSNGVTLAEVKAAIMAACKHFGIDVSDDSGGGGASRSELFRSYPLEEAHVVTRAEGDGSGRLVEAYCAVFDEAAEIRDHEGHYEEEIDRAAFNKRIADVQRSRAGYGLVKCIYNHGMTLHGTPAERFSLPPAVCKHISAESRGVLTRSYYLDTPLGNELLEMWREGAISAQSFTGAIIRSTPQLRWGEKYRPRSGQLMRVRRLELGLKEYGATPFPAYTGAELVGVRMSPLGTYQAAEYEEEEAALPPDGEAAAGEPLNRTEGGEHSARYHQHALYAMRSRELREKAGLDW